MPFALMGLSQGPLAERSHNLVLMRYSQNLAYGVKLSGSIY